MPMRLKCVLLNLASKIRCIHGNTKLRRNYDLVIKHAINITVNIWNNIDVFTSGKK